MLGHVHFCFQAIFYLVYISCCHQLDLCIQKCLVYLMQWNKALLKTLSSNILISLLTLVETESSLWVSSNFMWTKTNGSELWKESTHNQHVGDFIDRHNTYTLRLSPDSSGGYSFTAPAFNFSLVCITMATTQHWGPCINACARECVASPAGLSGLSVQLFTSQEILSIWL